LPYPFAQLPTFAEFRVILEQEFGCEFKQEFQIINEVNDSYPVTYFERDMGGRVLDYVVVFPADINERMSLGLLRSIIQRLEIDPKRFGLTLDQFD
jgi:hypothetical protein